MRKRVQIPKKIKQEKEMFLTLNTEFISLMRQDSLIDSFTYVLHSWIFENVSFVSKITSIYSVKTLITLMFFPFNQSISPNLMNHIVTVLDILSHIRVFLGSIRGWYKAPMQMIKICVFLNLSRKFFQKLIKMIWFHWNLNWLSQYLVFWNKSTIFKHSSITSMLQLLAHLIWKLKWAFLIVCCQSSV